MNKLSKINEGIFSQMVDNKIGKKERDSEVIVMDGVDTNHSFTDKNGVFHKKGFIITGERPSPFKLGKLIDKLIVIRGPECDLNDIDVSNVRIFTSMFSGSSFNGDISGWDVSEARVFAYMFLNCPFNKDISKWNISNVVNFDTMFANYNGTVDRTNINVSEWKPSSNHLDSSMKSMFLNAIIDEDFHNWNINKNVKKTGMFSGCENKNPYGIPKWYRGQR